MSILTRPLADSLRTNFTASTRLCWKLPFQKRRLKLATHSWPRTTTSSPKFQQACGRNTLHPSPPHRTSKTLRAKRSRTQIKWMTAKSVFSLQKKEQASLPLCQSSPNSLSSCQKPRPPSTIDPSLTNSGWSLIRLRLIAVRFPLSSRRKKLSFANSGFRPRLVNMAIHAPLLTASKSSTRRHTLQASSAWPCAAHTWMRPTLVSMELAANSVTFPRISLISKSREPLTRTCSKRTQRSWKWELIR